MWLSEWERIFNFVMRRSGRATDCSAAAGRRSQALSWCRHLGHVAELKRDLAILNSSGPEWTQRMRRLAARVADLDVFGQLEQIRQSPLSASIQPIDYDRYGIESLWRVRH